VVKTGLEDTRTEAIVFEQLSANDEHKLEEQRERDRRGRRRRPGTRTHAHRERWRCGGRAKKRERDHSDAAALLSSREPLSSVAVVQYSIAPASVFPAGFRSACGAGRLEQMRTRPISEWSAWLAGPARWLVAWARGVSRVRLLRRGCKGSKCASAVAKFVVSRQQIVVWLWLPSIVLSCGRRWALEQLEVGASSSALMVGAMERTRSSGELAYYRWTALSEGARLSRQAFLRGWRFIRASIAYLAN